jgi:hypothetical protein
MQTRVSCIPARPIPLCKRVYRRADPRYPDMGRWIVLSSELFVLQLPCLDAVYQEANVDDLARDACSAGHVRPHLGKLELLEILVKRNIKETYDKEPPNLMLASIFCWALFLREKLQKLMELKLQRFRSVTLNALSSALLSLGDAAEAVSATELAALELQQFTFVTSITLSSMLLSFCIRFMVLPPSAPICTESS